MAIALLRQLLLCLSARLRRRLEARSGGESRPTVTVQSRWWEGVVPGREAREGPLLGAKGYKGLC